MTTKIKEKTSISKSAKEKIQAAPKELLRRGLLTEAEKLQGQLRDAAEGGRREDTEADRTQAAVRMTTQRAAYRLKKLAHGKKKVWTGRLESRVDASSFSSDDPVPDSPIGQTGAPDTAEPVPIKTRESAHRSLSAERRSPDPPRAETQIKTRDAYVQSQTAIPAQEPAVKNTGQSERQTPQISRQGRQKFAREQARNTSTMQTEEHRRLDQTVSVPTQESYGSSVIRQNVGRSDHNPAPKPDSQHPRPLEQGRQRFVRERQKNAVVRGSESIRGPERAAPARQQDIGGVRPRHTPASFAQDRKRPTGNATWGTVSNSKRRIKEARSGAKAVGRTSRQAVKGSESSGKALQASGRSTQTMRQTVRTAVQAKLRAVQTAGTARRASETVGRPVVKAVAAALRGTVAAARSLAPLLAAGGGVVFAVVLVLCMVGAILASPLGIFFSLFGENSGGGQQQATITISAVVQELNQEYDARLDEIRANASYDEESLIGSRAPWSEILAVYAVKTATAPANEQEVVTMTDGKKALLEQIFWDMNELTSFTSTVPGTGNGEEDTTTLYITVTAKTAYEMADIYGFNDDQRQQLAELLSDGYLEMWNDAL